MRWGLAGLLAMVGACLGQPAMAGISYDRIDAGNGRILILQGTFEFQDDPASLAAEVASFQPTLISFNSGGGNVMAAMRFGRAIRQMALSTLQIRSANCASACTLTFMGGIQRFAEPGAIGVHQASFSSETGIDGHLAVAAVQSLTADIMTYMIEMGVDPQLMQLSLATESSDMRYLTAGEMRRYRVTTEGEADIATVQPITPSAPTSAARKIPTQPESPDVLAFLHRYHAAWSSSNHEAMSFVRSAYAERVSYFGKTATRAAILKEKETFAKRWPIRSYAIRSGSENVQCVVTCRVEAIIDWRARSDERGKTASGAATIAIEWDPATQQIVLETSKVLKVERSSTRPDQLIAQWQGEDNRCRGGSGNQQSTLDACERREAVGQRLSRLDWCYGRQGEYGYQHQWHACGRDSNR